MRKLFFAGLLFGLLATLILLGTRMASAQCDPAGGPCEPEKERKTKRPTDTPRATETATPAFMPMSTGVGGTLIPVDTAPPTEPAWYQTLVSCQGNLEATAIATMGRDLLPSEHSTAIAPCKKYNPTPTQFLIPPVSGPVFVPPGVKNGLILVMVIGALVGGAFALRRFRQPGPVQKK